ncbi:MAG TPA: DUF1206 domain-containing protein [Xanthobacteraceae bacterium]|jgi:hypothetical protein
MKGRSFEWMARIGYVTRGTVFLVLGAVTMLAAFGSLRRPAEPKDVLHTLLSHALGGLAVAAISAGLLCFAVWRIVQALLDADRCGSDLKGLARRGVFFIQGLFYVALAGIPATMLLGTRPSSDQAVRDWTGWLLQWPFGRWVLALTGVIVIVSAVATGINGIRAHFKRRLAVRGGERTIITALGQFGFVARAIVYAAVGAFLLMAALHADPGEARGVAGTLRAIQQESFGSIWLALAAAGFLAFGCYSIAEGAWRRVEAPTVHQAAVRAGVKR